MKNISLNAFLAQHAADHQLPENLIDLLLSITDACGHINDKVRLGALAGILGEAGTGNVQGEDQKKLDVMANTLLIDALSANPAVAGLASEEENTYVAAHADGEYLVLFDPLDGSSNIDVNISVGTIFSILAHPKGAPLSTESFLQKGSDQVAAGYVLYGPQTQLVFTAKHGVFVFTLNADGAFMLTQQKLHIPAQTQEFAINMSNHRHWARPVQDYVGELLLGAEGPRGKNFNTRWG
ncbi:MAG: fructose-1,6-bisphosphatase, partial [Neisseriaceae bacterium]|nr:fructose-1,6-bisphosphatase [Neisseriaceae bacterium]